jgi:hypothetical protein
MQASRVTHTAYRWAAQFFDPRQILSAVRGLFWYWSDWRRYSALPGAERLSLLESYPQFHDRVGMTPLDAHYFYANGWAMRRILSQHPAQHVDIGSQTIFANLLGATMPVVFVDYRPLAGGIEGVSRVGASILDLPMADRSLSSLSCLHVAEHIGLGRYGDPLDPLGTRKAATELARVLAPSGNLFFAIPVGRPRVCFNAHRVHAPATVREYFRSLELVEFSAVDDRGRYIERPDMETVAGDRYACGLFWFRRPAVAG